MLEAGLITSVFKNMGHLSLKRIWNNLN